MWNVAILLHFTRYMTFYYTWNKTVIIETKLISSTLWILITFEYIWTRNYVKVYTYDFLLFNVYGQYFKKLNSKQSFILCSKDY
jgi:hypothetical protein